MAGRSNRDRSEENPIYPKSWETPPGNVPQRSDADIKRDIEDRLFYHPDVRSFEVKVDVANGLVTLSGTVDDDAARVVCENVARATPGVKEIRNNLQVKPPVKG